MFSIFLCFQIRNFKTDLVFGGALWTGRNINSVAVYRKNRTNEKRKKTQEYI